MFLTSISSVERISRALRAICGRKSDEFDDFMSNMRIKIPGFSAFYVLENENMSNIPHRTFLEVKLRVESVFGVVRVIIHRKSGQFGEQPFWPAIQKVYAVDRKCFTNARNARLSPLYIYIYIYMHFSLLYCI